MNLIFAEQRHSCGCTGCVHSQHSYYNKNTCKCKCFVSFSYISKTSAKFPK
ncbi:hypothetical protein EJA00_08695 [Streptococcus suis]|uniref:Uncharacterized protein n=1 Tax=Streptococcus suis TaxID=1307 RepID=A0A3R8XJ93_STRSU|nr:hypothetical protein EJA00_08695 [Streptococcus suis]